MSSMKKTTKKLTEFQLKVKALLDNADSNVINEFFNSELINTDQSKYDSDKIRTFKSTCELEFHHIDNYGGECQGEDYWSVYKFTDYFSANETYVKFDGWYQSYNGSEFSEWFFVNTVVKSVTFYE